MVKTFLQHLIFETAINTFFQGLSRSFRSPVTDEFEVGSRFNYIEISYVEEDEDDPHPETFYGLITYHNVVVTKRTNHVIWIESSYWEDEMYDSLGNLIEQKGANEYVHDIVVIDEIVKVG